MSRDVCFTPNSGHQRVHRRRPLCANSGLIGKISREYFSRSFQNPAVVQYANEAAARAVAMGRPRAAAVLNELHDSRSERVRLEAAKASVGAIVAPADPICRC
jgi:hypothetical protein